MKKIIFTCLFFFVLIYGYSQQFIYEYKNNLTEHSDEFILAVDGHFSYFNTVNSVYNAEYLSIAAKQLQNIDVGKMKRGSQLKVVVEKTADEIYNYQYLFGANIVLTTTKEDLKWKPLNETKTLDGKTLHKATVNYGGRNWIAWYNLAIPFQEGPYVFAGLPGLIEEIYDSEKQHQFTLKGKPKENYKIEFVEVEKRSRYTRSSYSHFFTLLEEAKKNPFEFRETYASLKLSMTNVEITPEMIKRSNESARKTLSNYIIERSQPTQ